MSIRLIVISIGLLPFRITVAKIKQLTIKTPKDYNYLNICYIIQFNFIGAYYKSTNVLEYKQNGISIGIFIYSKLFILSVNLYIIDYLGGIFNAEDNLDHSNCYLYHLWYKL